MNCFCQSKSITKTIATAEGDKEVKFYSIPVGVILKMKTTGKALSKLIAVLLTDKSADVGQELITTPSDTVGEDGTPYINTHKTVKEISPSMASFRHKQVVDGIDGLFDTLMAPETQELLSEIIVRSAKDVFSPDDQKDLMETMDTGVFVQFLTGAFEASAEGISGLGKFLSPQMRQGMEKAKARMTLHQAEGEKRES